MLCPPPEHSHGLHLIHAMISSLWSFHQTKRGGVLFVPPGLEVFRWPEHEEEGQHDDVGDMPVALPVPRVVSVHVGSRESPDSAYFEVRFFQLKRD